MYLGADSFLALTWSRECCCAFSLLVFTIHRAPWNWELWISFNFFFQQSRTLSCVCSPLLMKYQLSPQQQQRPRGGVLPSTKQFVALKKRATKKSYGNCYVGACTCRRYQLCPREVHGRPSKKAKMKKKVREKTQQSTAALRQWIAASKAAQFQVRLDKQHILIHKNICGKINVCFMLSSNVA